MRVLLLVLIGGLDNSVAKEIVEQYSVQKFQQSSTGEKKMHILYHVYMVLVCVNSQMTLAYW